MQSETSPQRSKVAASLYCTDILSGRQSVHVGMTYLNGSDRVRLRWTLAECALPRSLAKMFPLRKKLSDPLPNFYD